jgi:glucose-6-phosphate isomerase
MRTGTDCPAWRELEGLARTLGSTATRQLFAQDPQRFAHCCVESTGFALDFSRQRVDGRVLDAFASLADQLDLRSRIEAMFRGDHINTTEDRAVLHTALRRRGATPLMVDGTDVNAQVMTERERVLKFAEDVRQGRIRSSTDASFSLVVNIGIGGSDLGPAMAVEALQPETKGAPRVAFVSNVDGCQLADIIAEADPARTLFIICSKTFVTLETQSNAHVARSWIQQRLGGKAVPQHFAAVSVNARAMDEFGVHPDYRFAMWDWVGGRYSIWSAIGVSLAIAIGRAGFESFLDGGREIDEHFRAAPWRENLPVIAGLLAVWNIDLLNLPTLGVMPYDSRLARLPAYLQQLEMESNGKHVKLDGSPTTLGTCAVVWGEPGSNAQHSFFQMLHQGTLTQALDFIAPLRGSWGGTEGQDLALKNSFAQSQAFAYGYTLAEVEADMRKAGVSAAEISRIAVHRVHEGNRPSSLLMYPQTTAATLGGLIALYEHSVFVQGSVWGVNSFDQFGVELGKKLAVGIDLSGAKAPQGSGAAGLAAMISYVKTHR